MTKELTVSVFNCLERKLDLWSTSYGPFLCFENPLNQSSNLFSVTLLQCSCPPRLTFVFTAHSLYFSFFSVSSLLPYSQSSFFTVVAFTYYIPLFFLPLSLSYMATNTSISESPSLSPSLFCLCNTALDATLLSLAPAHRLRWAEIGTLPSPSPFFCPEIWLFWRPLSCLAVLEQVTRTGNRCSEARAEWLNILQQ